MKELCALRADLVHARISELRGKVPIPHELGNRTGMDFPHATTPKTSLISVASRLWDESQVLKEDIDHRLRCEYAQAQKCMSPVPSRSNDHPAVNDPPISRQYSSLLHP